LDNVRASLEWSAKDGSDVDHALTVAGRLWWFWQSHAYYREGRHHLERLLARTGAATAPESRTEALIGAAMLAFTQGGSDDLTVARGMLTEAVAISRARGNNQLLVHALGPLARVIRDQDDYVAARLMLQETLELAEDHCDVWGQARSLNGLGITASLQGDLTYARDCFERSLERSRSLGDEFGVATQLHNLGVLAYRYFEAS
jgi:tetratricopeptide (TPR) repeat protein